jgi:hypothetical protein
MFKLLTVLIFAVLLSGCPTSNGTSTSIPAQAEGPGEYQDVCTRQSLIGEWKQLGDETNEYYSENLILGANEYTSVISENCPPDAFCDAIVRNGTWHVSLDTLVLTPFDQFGSDKVKIVDCSSDSLVIIRNEITVHLVRYE